MNKHFQTRLQSLPNAPGIYLFYNKNGHLLYVGKATSLKSRVRSYFRASGKSKTSRPIEDLIHEVARIEVKETDSVLEAIILEGAYIKKYQPKYNVDWRDDKSWNYIVLTKEPFPRAETLRAHELNRLLPAERKKSFLYLFGPYPGMNTRAALKILRRLFLFSTCQKRRGKEAGKPCLYYQMGQCLGVCTKEVSPAEYKKKVIRPLVMFLRGNKKGVVRSLTREMREASRAHSYEEASRLRDQIASLSHIQDIALLNKTFVDFPLAPRRAEEPTISRIEGYDISNLGKTGMVGSMVVFENGAQKPSDYRRFKIRGVSGQSDVDCLEEVLRRRLNHPEWPMSDLVLVDGGKPQVGRAVRVFAQAGVELPIIGIAKGPERKKNEFHFGRANPAVVRWVQAHQNVLIRVRDEAHRFAISYQRKLRGVRK